MNSPHSKKSQRSLRYKIAVILGLTSLAVLLVSVVLSVHQYENQIQKQTSRELRSLSLLISATIDHQASHLIQVLRVAALQEEFIRCLGKDDPRTLSAFIWPIIEAGSLDYAEAVRADGQVMFSLTGNRSIGDSSLNPLVNTALTRQKTSRGLLREDDHLYIVATMPAMTAGRPSGAVTFGVDVCCRRLDDYGTNPNNHLAIWKDPDCQVLASPGKLPLPPLPALLTSQEREKIKGGRYLEKRLKLPDDDVVALFSTLPELGSEGHPAVCAVYQSVQFLNQAGFITFANMILPALLIFLTATSFSWWISKIITDPLVKLKDAAQRLAAFDFSAPVPTAGNGEIRELSRTINSLSEALQENISKKDHYAQELAGLNVNLERQVAQRTEDLVHANERLEREMAEKEDFLRAISHDLGAPLRNVAGLARLLERRHRKTLGDDGLEMLGRISNNVKNELSMIEMLLELSRIKTRRGKSTRVDLPEIIRQIREDLSIAIEEKRVQFSVQDGLPALWAEENRIRQVFQNLIDNAIKYMGDQRQPRLAIGWNEHPHHWMFWVSDNGIGIPDDQRHKIFGVFRRVRSRETCSVEGKGIGLSSVKTIVEMYGGEIWVESQLGQGSTFYFTLNRSQVDPEGRLEEDVEESEEFATTSV